MLKVEGLNSFYGPIQALRDVSLHVETGEAVGILGPNGAGKSTLLRTISGLLKPKQGSIEYEGRDIAGVPPHSVVKLGIAHVPEGRRIFTQLTVMENLLMGAFSRSDKNEINEDLDFTFSLFPDLKEKKGQLGGELSGGQQQMLAFGRALMSRPSLLLLDEPSLGLSPLLVEQLSLAPDAIRDRLGMSLLLVEQNVGLAMDMVTRFYVMQTGTIVMDGTTDDISPEQIRQAYLGGPSKDS